MAVKKGTNFHTLSEMDSLQLQAHCDKASDHILKDKCLKYDAEKHVPLLLRVFMQGDTVYEFCAAALVGKTTFFKWVKVHKEFGEAYEMGKIFSQCVWHRKGQDKELNFQYWSMIMKNRFDFTDHRKLSVPKIKGSKTFTTQFAAILEELQNGNLTSHEASQLSNLIIAGQKIEHADNVETLRKQMITVSQHLGLSHEALAA